MPIKSYIATVFVVAAISPLTATGRVTDDRFAVFSVGADSCSHYLSARQQGNEAFLPYQQWLLGYLSAFNAIVADTYDILGGHKNRHWIDWLDRYCKRHPGESLVSASAALTVSLYPQRHSSAPETEQRYQWTTTDGLRTDITTDTP